VIKIEKRILSPTAINTYLSCPRKYYLRYIKKLPSKPSIHLIRGSIVHKTLHEFNVSCIRGPPYRDIGEITDTLLMIFNRLWLESKNSLDALGLLPGQVEDFRTESEAMLINFSHWFVRQKIPPVVTSSELKLFSGRLGLMGIIDAVRINDNGVFLIDYKTSKDYSITDDIFRQAVLYCLLFQDRNDEIPLAVYIHFLKDPGDPMAVFIDDAQLAYGRVLIDFVHDKTGTNDERNYPCTCGGYCERDFTTKR
jgi:putative RecB family exonuclease